MMRAANTATDIVIAGSSISLKVNGVKWRWVQMRLTDWFLMSPLNCGEKLDRETAISIRRKVLNRK